MPRTIARERLLCFHQTGRCAAYCSSGAVGICEICGATAQQGKRRSRHQRVPRPGAQCHQPHGSACRCFKTVQRPRNCATRNERSVRERERLIRRRWSETGIRLWNPDFHGAGHAALNIQGQSKLLPPNPGEKMPRYDTLEFKMIRSNVEGQAVDRIVCEGVIVEAPKRGPGRSGTALNFS
jgi:hypothetical protein